MDGPNGVTVIYTIGCIHGLGWIEL